jgi:hypothetical protein
MSHIVQLCCFYKLWYVQCILLLFNVGNVLLCVIYQLNFIIGMYVNEKRLIYRVHYYPR